MELVGEKSQYEIERGKPMPSKHHAFVQMKIGHILLSNYEQYWILPELSLELNDKILIPDLAIYEKANFDLGEDEIRITQIPLGVIEILSPKQNVGDLLINAKYYFQAGVQSYWLVMPGFKAIFVYSNEEDYEVYKKKELLKDELLKIELDLGKIF